MNVKIVTAVIAFVIHLKICQSRRYDNYILYKVLPTRKVHLKFLQNLDSEKYLDVMFWTKPSRVYNEVHFIAASNETDTLKERFDHFGLPIEIVNNNIQKAFDKQVIQEYLHLRSETFTWTNYHGLADIYLWMKDVSLQYTSLINLEMIGKSAEDREIYAVSVRRNRSVNKPIVIIEAGTHGHEWIGPMFATYIINQLIHVHKADDSRLSELADAYDWYIIPVVNPDGFLYSQKEDRLWRKNRRVTGENSTGVDLNKNYNYSFGLHDASLDPNDGFYCGPHPFSEPESTSVANFIIRKGTDVNFIFSIHSYGQMIILPYSDQIKHLENFPEIENFAKQAMVKMFKYNGTKYSVGTNYDTEGLRGSGDIISWAKKNLKLKYAAAFVLRDTGREGFALDPKHILPTCKETTIGLIELMTAKPRTIRSFDMFRRNKAEKSSQPNELLATATMIVLIIIIKD